MDLFRMVVIAAIISTIFKFIETGSLKSKEELSSHLNTISKSIYNLEEQQIGPSFGNITATTVKQVKSMLVVAIDDPSAPINQRLLMLETIKDLQKVEDFIADKEPVIREIEDYCEALIENNIFKKGRNKINNVNTVLKYIDELNAPVEIDKNKLKRDIDSIILVLTVKARHISEIEKLVDYLQVRKIVIDGVMNMDRYIETLGFTIRDMRKLQNKIQNFAPFVDHFLDRKEDIKQMNSIYSSLVGKNLIESTADTKKIGFLMKMKMISSVDKLQHESPKWAKLVEELEHLYNM